MINAVNDVLSQKTVGQYKIIEDRYLTLKRYLRLKAKDSNYISKEDIELIVKSLDDEPMEEVKEDNE